ncbi:MAG: integration host factor subunit beta [Gammaproteobacteria bacterium]|nr:integration host factor subunit beta [Gammaproteobacteria bacterium]
MTRSELVNALATRQTHLPAVDVDLAVRTLFEVMSEALGEGRRIEIRGFGCFSLRYRPPRLARNPKSGEVVAVAGKCVPHFKPGKALRETVRGSAAEQTAKTKRYADR